ncbi:MAG: TonB-dependent receptor, partial [Sphingobacteriia bacterium]
MNQKFLAILVFSFFLFQQFSSAQPKATDIPANTDSNWITRLPELTVVGRNSKNDWQSMPKIVGTHIYAGKKANLIVMDNVQGNVVNNTMRQVMAKIPGIHIWESDPSGIQIGIAARGLSPNRSWEFNVRQNGYDISADPYGYPEAYYNPQLQAVQRIEVVRGQGALQYGPQYGGLVNYILKDGSEITKPFALESQQTVGSQGLFNSYNAIGGTKGKNHYYAFFDHRNGNGFRDNSRFFTNNGFITFSHRFSDRFKLTAEMVQSHIRSQQPGGLTDAQLANGGVRQSLRSRNWMDISWATYALMADWQINAQTRLNTKVFGISGDRNSVGFLQAPNVKDSINPATLTYANRTAQTDQYRNWGMESRFITAFELGQKEHQFSAGIRYFKGHTQRFSGGRGTTGSDYDMNVIGAFNGDIQFVSQNTAAFAEAIFKLSKKWLLVPGIRWENVSGSAAGRNGFSNGQPIVLQNIHRNRSFALAALGLEYHLSAQTEFYANAAQAYRPIQFAQLQAAPTTDIIDPNLTDSKGYTLEAGYRGKHKNWLHFDVSFYHMVYGDRVGTLAQSNGTRLVTNVGNSEAYGVEGFVQLNLLKIFQQNSPLDLSVFGSWGWNHAAYVGNLKDPNLQNKKV